jgi:hypothetical protein
MEYMTFEISSCRKEKAKRVIVQFLFSFDIESFPIIRGRGRFCEFELLGCSD